MGLHVVPMVPLHGEKQSNNNAFEVVSIVTLLMSIVPLSGLFYVIAHEMYPG